MQIWNFSSGECLKELEGISNQEITGIICLQVRLAAACIFEPTVLLPPEQYSPAVLSWYDAVTVHRLLTTMLISVLRHFQPATMLAQIHLRPLFVRIRF